MHISTLLKVNVRVQDAMSLIQMLICIFSGSRIIACFQECTGLREELDAQHRKRMESFEIQLKPIIIRDGPSKKVLERLYLKGQKSSSRLLTKKRLIDT